MSFRSVSEARAEAGSAAMTPREDDSRERRSTSRDSGETQFGVEPYRDGHETVLQRLAQQHGSDQVRQWAAEGMPIETMGKTLDMADFRERQRERPPEVPTDIERRNAKSVQRSRGAHHESSFGGEMQVPDSVRSVISASGQRLDADIQQAMEDRMGDSLGDVRIHTGPQAAKACDDIKARAFTVGNHVAFNHGEYDPESPEGQHVLAHELAHVRQQIGGAVSMLPQEGELAIDPDERLEREAEETAEQVMRGGTIGVHRMRRADMHVQRMADDSEDPIFTAERDGTTKTLYQGDESKGWVHIRKRHLEGSAGNNKRTSFFPAGQTISRADGDATLDPEMTKVEIKQSIQDAIEEGTKDENDPADVYILEREDHEFNLGDIRVITGLNGDVITVYPVEGPETPVWKPNSGWENV